MGVSFDSSDSMSPSSRSWKLELSSCQRLPFLLLIIPQKNRLKFLHQNLYSESVLYLFSLLRAYWIEFDCRITGISYMEHKGKEWSEGVRKVGCQQNEQKDMWKCAQDWRNSEMELERLETHEQNEMRDTWSLFWTKAGRFWKRWKDDTRKEKEKVKVEDLKR